MPPIVAHDGCTPRQLLEAARALLREAWNFEKGPADIEAVLHSIDKALATRGSAPAPSMTIGADARMIRLASGARLDLNRHRALRLILLALAHERIQRPGQALTAVALVEQGWPGERVLQAAGLLRVRVALSKLREMGLREALVTRDDGYLLRPEVGVVLATDGTLARMPPSSLEADASNKD